MTIKTELNIGDYVYFLFNNKIQNRKIERINVITDGDNKQVLYEVTIKTEYTPTEDMGRIEDMENIPQPTERKTWINSNNVYSNKEELFKNILEESK